MFLAVRLTRRLQAQQCSILGFCVPLRLLPCTHWLTCWATQVPSSCSGGKRPCVPKRLQFIVVSGLCDQPWILETGEDKAAAFPPASTWHPPTNQFPFWLPFYAQAQSWEALSLLFTRFSNSLITFRAQVFEIQTFLCCASAVITFL